MSNKPEIRKKTRTLFVEGVDRSKSPKENQADWAFDNLSEDLKGFADELYIIFGEQLRPTSATRLRGEVGKEGSRHETGEAIDLGPNEKIYDFLSNTVEGVLLMKKYGLGLLDERTEEVLSETGGTAPHLHIGKDSALVKNTENRYNELLKDDNIKSKVLEVEKRLVSEYMSDILKRVDTPVYNYNSITIDPKTGAPVYPTNKTYSFTEFKREVKVPGKGEGKTDYEYKTPNVAPQGVEGIVQSEGPDTNQQYYQAPSPQFSPEYNKHLADLNYEIEKIKLENEKTKEEKELEKKQEAYLRAQQEEIQKRKNFMAEVARQDQQDILEQQKSITSNQQSIQERPRVQIANTSLPPLPKFITQLPQQQKYGGVKKYRFGGEGPPKIDESKTKPLGYYRADPLDQVEVAESTDVNNPFNKAKIDADNRFVEIAENISRENPSMPKEKVMYLADAAQKSENAIIKQEVAQPTSYEAMSPTNKEFSEKVLDSSFTFSDALRTPLDFLATGSIADDEKRYNRRFNQYNPNRSTLEKIGYSGKEAAGLGAQAALNLAITRGLMPYASQARILGETVLPIGGADDITNLSKYLTTQTPFKNTYKYIPGTVKEAPFVPMYRTQKPGQTQEILELLDLQKKANQVGYKNLSITEKVKLSQFQSRPNIGQGFDTDLTKANYYGHPNIRRTRGYDETPEVLRVVVPREQAELLNVKNFPQYAKQSTAHRTEHILPMDMIQQAEKFSFDDLARLRKEESLLNPKPHWLKGYPKQLPQQKYGGAYYPPLFR